MNILALDLGQNCGWAAHIDGKRSSGVWRLRPTKFESSGHEYLKFKRNLEAMIIFDNIEKVYFEAVRRHKGTDAAHCYGGYFNTLRIVCIENGIPYEGFAVQTIKKAATGSGVASKDQMIAAAIVKNKSVNVIDDNHADALHILDYALKFS